MKKKYVLSLALVISGLLFQGCGTFFASGITSHQSQKPAKGEPARKVRPGIAALDCLVGIPAGGVGAFILLWIDHQSGALYKKAPEVKR